MFSRFDNPRLGEVILIQPDIDNTLYTRVLTIPSC